MAREERAIVEARRKEQELRIQASEAAKAAGKCPTLCVDHALKAMVFRVLKVCRIEQELRILASEAVKAAGGR